MFLLYLLFGILLVVFVSYVIYREDVRLGYPVPPQISVNDWLQDKHKWNSFGHFMLDFVLTVLFTTILLVLVALSWPGTYIGAFLIKLLVSHTLLFCFLAMIPSTLLTLYIEIVADQHWKTFVGQPDDTKDFLFDVFTHLTGGVVAAFLMCSLLLAVKETVVHLIVAMGL